LRRLLVLRPEVGAEATVAKARAAGLEAIATPLFRIESVEWRAPDAGSFDGLLLTSANAVRNAGEQLEDLRGLKVYAVGEATAEAARSAGFDIAATGDSGVDRLLGSIDANLRMIHLCGPDRRETRDARQRITPLVVYRSQEIDQPDLSCAPGKVALVHSPRAGKRFAELVYDRNSIAVAAISAAALKAVGGGWETAEVADAPNDDALLALAARLCNKPDPE